MNCGKQQKGLECIHPIDDSYEGIVRYVNRNPHTSFVAKVKQEEIVSGHHGRRSYIYHTGVVEAYRKQDVGNELVNYALHALKKESIHEAALVAFQNNDIGNTF